MNNNETGKDKIYRRPTQSSGTPKKKKNEKARKRNVIINFRVFPQEKALIDNRINLSGLSKSEFFIQSCLYQTILVKGNIKTFDEIKKQLEEIKKHVYLSGDLSEMDYGTLEVIRDILEIFEKIYCRNNR
ncbi:MAG: hypothetical protein IJ763_10960 [Lachnospiraceae bacterium]|nr:hypothetical protein [Lachnospiraceae bacterium]MBR1817198.1 hypothetical protein [Lachnospiraceae bacterium]